MPLLLPQSHDTDGSMQFSGVETMAAGVSYPGHWVLVIGLLCCHCFQMIGIFGRQLVSVHLNVTVERYVLAITERAHSELAFF